jgi:hypothetical protein
MTTKIGLPLTTYELLNTPPNLLDTTPEEEDEWITTSTATLVRPNITLYMRSPGVEVCIGLRSRKRAVSPDSEPLSPPFTRFPSRLYLLAIVSNPCFSPANTPSPAKRIRSSTSFTYVFSPLLS